MKHIVSSVTIAACLLLPSVGAVFAAANPAGTGQPGQSCQAQTAMPGNSVSSTTSPGSPFLAGPMGPTGGVSTTVYAGTQPQNSNNPHSVSQYDVACFQLSQPSRATTKQIP
jgi:hypothetical protein